MPGTATTPPYFPPPPAYSPPANPGRGRAIASMVLGIVALVFFYIGFPMSLVGLPLAVSARSEGQRGGIATTGLVLNIVSLSICALVWVLIFIGMRQA